MIDVYVTDDISIDPLRQVEWPFEVRWHEGTQIPQSGELFYDREGVGLSSPDGQKPLRLSWEEGLRHWMREKRASLVQNSLCKALGLKEAQSVIDATVGLGKDSCLLLALGHTIIGYERSPKIYFLQRASQITENFLLERLTLNFGSVTNNPENFPLYFDPMFDDGKKRKALPNKGMALFHKLVGGDSDAKEEAMRLRELTSRLVIKRAPKAEMLLEKRNSCWESKAVRFDLYL